MAGDPRIVIADRSPFTRTLLRTVFTHGRMDVAAETGRCDDLLALCHEVEPDVLVTDVQLLDGDIDGILPDLIDAGFCVLVLSDDRSPERFTAVLEAGASGYILYDTAADAVVDAVRAVARGAAALDPAAAGTVLYQWRNLRAREAAEPPRGSLTARETDVLEAMSAGMAAKAIARELGVAVKTVENHKIRIFEKLGVRTQAQAVSVAINDGLLTQRSNAGGAS